MLRLSETEVILTFLEDCLPQKIKDVGVEFPAGSWSGNKSRNQGDIHAEVNIEAKGSWKEARKDMVNKEKNKEVDHYIFSSEKLDKEEIDFLKYNNKFAAIYLPSVSKWFILEGENKVFSSLLRRERILDEISWKQD